MYLPFVRFGRRRVLLYGTAMFLIFGIAAAFATDVFTFMVLRFFVAFSMTALYTTGFVYGESTRRGGCGRLYTERCKDTIQEWKIRGFEGVRAPPELEAAPSHCQKHPLETKENVIKHHLKPISNKEGIKT